VGLPPSRRVWIFDLDNTLHDAQVHIFPSMHDQINLYLMRRFDLDEAGANDMRRGFWQRYGTTMNGLMRHHGTDPREFLAATHQFPELARICQRVRCSDPSQRSDMDLAAILYGACGASCCPVALVRKVNAIYRGFAATPSLNAVPGVQAGGLAARSVNTTVLSMRSSIAAPRACLT
jgi:hypothetical protein